MAPKKKDNLGFVLTSGAREIKPSLTFEGYMIYIKHFEGYINMKCLWRRITFGTAHFLYLRLQSGTFVFLLSWEVSFMSTANKIPPEMHCRQRSTKVTMTFKTALNGQNWTWRAQKINVVPASFWWKSSACGWFGPQNYRSKGCLNFKIFFKDQVFLADFGW